MDDWCPMCGRMVNTHIRRGPDCYEHACELCGAVLERDWDDDADDDDADEDDDWDY